MFDYFICDCDGVFVDSEVIVDCVLFDMLFVMFFNFDFEVVVKLVFGQQMLCFFIGIEFCFGIEMFVNFIEIIEYNIEIVFV